MTFLSNPSDVHRAFLLVGDTTKASTWKLPICELPDLTPSAKALKAASKQLIEDSVKLSTEPVPLRAAAKHLCRLMEQIEVEVPEQLKDLSRFQTYEEADAEVAMLKSLQNGIMVGGILDMIEVIEKEMQDLPMTNEALAELDPDALIHAIESIKDTQKAVKTLQEIASEKGIEDDIEGNGVRVKRAARFSNAGKRVLSDYYATDEELEKINSLSNTDLKADDVLVFTLESANLQVDRQWEHFEEKALRRMAELSVDKAFLIDHSWTTADNIGKIFDAGVSNGNLVQKIYILNDDMNERVIKNILAGIYNKVSVGFSTNVEDMVCESCKKSIYSMDCPHMPGSVDEEGKKVIVAIKDVADYFEVSLVPVPAQRDAGIRRRSLEELSEKTKSLIEGALSSKRPETIEYPKLLAADLAAVIAKGISDALPDEKNTVDTIDSGKTEETPGGNSVSEPTTPNSTPIEDVLASLKEIAEALQGIIAEAKTLQEEQKAIVKSLEELQKGSSEKIAEIAEAQKAQATELTSVKQIVEAATTLTVEQIERELAAVKAVPVEGGSNHWVMELSRALGGS